MPGVLAFQVRTLTTLSAALPHQSLRRILNPSFGIQASNFSHIKRRLSRIHLHGIQASESKIRNPSSKIRNPSRRRLHQLFVASTSTESMHRFSVTLILHASFVTSTSTESKHQISKKFKLRISATSTLYPRAIGGVRQAITFVLYTHVANDGRK